MKRPPENKARELLRYIKLEYFDPALKAAEEMGTNPRLPYKHRVTANINYVYLKSIIEDIEAVISET